MYFLYTSKWLVVLGVSSENVVRQMSQDLTNDRLFVQVIRQWGLNEPLIVEKICDIMLHLYTRISYQCQYEIYI